MSFIDVPSSSPLSGRWRDTEAIDKEALLRVSPGGGKKVKFAVPADSDNGQLSKNSLMESLALKSCTNFHNEWFISRLKVHPLLLHPGPSRRSFSKVTLGFPVLIDLI